MPPGSFAHGLQSSVAAQTEHVIDHDELWRSQKQGMRGAVRHSSDQPSGAARPAQVPCGEQREQRHGSSGGRSGELR